MTEDLIRDMQILDLRQEEMLDIAQDQANQRRSVMEHTDEGFLHSGNNKDKNIQTRSQLSRTLGVSPEIRLTRNGSTHLQTQQSKTEV